MLCTVFVNSMLSITFEHVFAFSFVEYSQRHATIFTRIHFYCWWLVFNCCAPNLQAPIEVRAPENLFRPATDDKPVRCHYL